MAHARRWVLPVTGLLRRLRRRLPRCRTPRHGPRHVVLYGRPGCHLCDRAEELLRAEQARAGFELDVVDIDRDPVLHDRYTVRVPVVTVDGVERFQYEIPEQRLRQVLRRRSRWLP